MKTVRTTLLYAYSEATDEVLMVRGFRSWNAGLINFPGGKLEPGETYLENIGREVFEETGYRFEKMFPVGFLKLINHEKDCVVENVFFCGSGIYGALRARGEECEPYWQPRSDMPYDSMYPADREWLPALFSGEQFHFEIIDPKSPDYVSRHLPVSSQLFERLLAIRNERS